MIPIITTVNISEQLINSDIKDELPALGQCRCEETKVEGVVF